MTSTFSSFEEFTAIGLFEFSIFTFEHIDLLHNLFICERWYKIKHKGGVTIQRFGDVSNHLNSIKFEDLGEGQASRPAFAFRKQSRPWLCPLSEGMNGLVFGRSMDKAMTVKTSVSFFEINSGI